MIGSLQMNEIIENAKVKGDKVVFIGDTKQFKSISAGRAFADMQKYGIKTVHMNEVLRQESDYTKKSVSLLKSRDVTKSIDILHSRDRIIEDETDKLWEKISNKFANLSKKKQKETLIIASTNSDRKAINDRIREKLGKKGLSFEVMESVNLQGISAHYTDNYKEGYSVVIDGDIEGFKKGEQLEIKEIIDDKRLIVKSKGKNAKPKELNVYDYGSSLQIYRKAQKGFEKGDVIVFSKNKKISKAKEKDIRVRNGERAIIKSINKKGDIVTDTGKKFNIHKMNYIDYGYAITDVKSQGATTKNVMIMAKSDMANFNSFYTQITRAKQDISLYTDNLEQLKANIAKDTKDKSTLDYTIKIKQKGEQVNERTSDKRRVAGDKEHTSRDTKRADATEKRDDRDKQNSYRVLWTSKSILERIRRRIKDGRQFGKSIKERITQVINKNIYYKEIVNKINEQRRQYNARKSTIQQTKERKHLRRTENVKRLARVGTLQSNITRTQGGLFRKDKNGMYGLSSSNLARHQFHPKMLLQTDVYDSMARGRQTNQSVRRERDSNSHDDGRVGIKESFKQFMKQHKAKDVEMVDNKKVKSHNKQQSKQHSPKSAKEFFKKRQLENNKKDRGR